MEKSLHAIEAKANTSNAAADPSASMNSSAVLAGMATSIKLISDALSAKNKSISTNGSVILDFLSELVSITGNIDSTKLDSLSNSATSISTFVNTFANLSIMGIAKIALAGKVLFGGKDPVVKRIIDGAVSAMNGFSDSDIKKMEQAGIGIHLLISGLANIGKAMATLALVSIIAPLVMIGAGVAWLVIKMFASLGTQLSEFKDGFAAIGIIGKGLVMLTAGLATMALLVSLVPVTTLLGVTAITMLVAGAFIVLGKGAEYIDKGAKAVQGIGIALIALSAGIATISLVMMLVPMKDLLGGMLLLAAYGLAFYLIGKLSKDIAQGALTIILGLSVGLFFFSGAMLLLSYTFSKFSMTDALLSVLVIGAFALMFELIGKLGKDIVQGSLGVASIGAGLAIFSVGILIFALALKGVLALFKNDYKEAAIGTVAILGGMAIMFGIIGAELPSIVAGAIGIGLIGASLLLFSAGIMVYALALKGVMALFKNDYKEAAIGAVAIIGGMSVLFAGIGLLAAPIGIGAIALGIVGASLGLFSVGLILFALSTKAIMKMGLYDEKEKTMKGMGIMFALGKEIAKMSILSVPILIGSVTALLLGTSLIAISAGLISAANAISKIPDPKDFTDKLFGEEGIIPALTNGFKKLYTDNSGSAGVLGLGMLRAITGTDPVQLGIKMVSGMGEILKELAGGIAAFSDPDHFPVQTANGKGGLSWQSVKLSTIVAGIQKSLLGDGLDSNNPGILYALANIFGSIGAKYPGGFFGMGKSDVKKGIDAVSGMGSVISDLAGGITSFANMNHFPIEYGPDGRPTKYGAINIPGIIRSISSVLNVLPSVFTKLDLSAFEDAEDKAKAAYELTKTFRGIAENLGSISNIYSKMKPIKVKNLETDAISAISSSITDMANNIQSSSLTDDSLTRFERLGNVLKSVSVGGSGFAVFVDAFIKLQDPLVRFASTLAVMGTNFDKLSRNIWQYRSFISFTNGLANNYGNMIKLSSPFSKIASDTGIFADGIARISEPSIKNFEKITAELQKMIDLDTTRFKDVAESAKKIADSAALMVVAHPSYTPTSAGGQQTDNSKPVPATTANLMTKIDMLFTEIQIMVQQNSSMAEKTGNLTLAVQELVKKLPNSF